MSAQTSNPSLVEAENEKGTAVYTPNVDEGKLLRKLDRNLLPILIILYLLSFLDRSNIGNARLEGLTTDLHITGNQYLTTLTIYFIGYVLFEIPANIVLKRTSPRIWLPSLTLAWGVVATLLGVCSSFSGFMVARFFLGVTESGLFPGVVFYLSMWYKRKERNLRVALFFSAASLAGAFGGILAWGIGHMRGVGHKNGWVWIFVIEGTTTVLVSIAAYFLVHNYPSTAKFLTEEERSAVQTRLKHDSDAQDYEPFTWPNVGKALKDPKVWLYGLGFHTMSLPLYTLSLFLPTIIKSLGYTSAQAQLMTIPPYAVATVLTVIISLISYKVQRKAPFIVCTSTLAILGYVILLSTPFPHKPGVAYFGTIVAAAGIYPSTALVLSWPCENVSGQTKRAVANALQISIGNLGAVIGTQLYRPKWAPRYFVGHACALAWLVGNVVVVSTLWYILSTENKKRDAGERNDRLVGLSEEEQRQLGDEHPDYRFRY